MRSFERTRTHAVCVAILALAVLVPAQVARGQEEALLKNGGFEAVRMAKPGADGLVSGWKLGDPPEMPETWTLNSHYVGQLGIETEASHSGERFVRITAPDEGSAHLYQMCAGLEADKWYEVSAWVRGGPLVISFYEYFDGRTPGTTSGGACQDTTGPAARAT